MLPGLKKRVVNFHDVLMYVAIFRKHLRLMALLICFSWLAGIVYYVYARPVYFSRALIKVDLVKRIITAEKTYDESVRVGSIVSQLTAPHIVERTAARLGVICEYREILRKYIKKIVAKRNSENNIEVEMYPYNQDWSKRWCETMLKEFIDYREQRRSEEWEQRAANAERDTEEFKKRLEKSKANITNTRVEYDIQNADLRYRELSNLPTDLVRARRRLDELGLVRMQLLDANLTTIEKLSRISVVTEKLPVGTSATFSTPAPRNEQNENDENSGTSAENPQNESLNVQVVTPGLQSDSTWRNLVDKLHNFEAEREKLSVDLLPGHKKMQAVQKQVDEINQQLEAELKSASERLEMEFNINLERGKDLNSKFPEYIKRQNELKMAKDMEGLAKSSQASWARYLAKIAQARDIDEVAQDDREKINFAYGGLIELKDFPISPNRFTLVIYTTLLGFFLAIGIPFLTEYLDDTFSNLEEVESTFRLRGLGIIPKMELAESSISLLLHPQAAKNSLLENFRVIRTNLLSMGSLSKPPHVLMVTSSMPKEGKTVVSTNLALSFAQSGAKTILIDTDLRRGRLHRLFGYRKQPGLSAVLLGQISLEEAIRPTPHENLTIISAGQHVDTGTELLGSQKFADIMTELRKRYDRIVVDTPPVLGLSETSVLQSHMDGVLFVIWSGHTANKAVKAAIEMLQSNGANFYGFVLNRLDLSATANYYQYYYYSHDYYYQYQPAPQLENS